MPVATASLTAIQRISIILALVGVFLLTALNVRMMVSEFYTIPARHLLTLENSREWRSRDAVYSRSLSGIEQALTLEKNNPEYMEIHGRLLIDRCSYWNKTDQWAEWQQCQSQALDAIRGALVVNARSPYLWANLLLVKFNLRQFDADFDLALRNARRFGAHEFGVNTMVAYIGLKEWLRWSPGQKLQFREATLAVQKVSSVEMRKIAEKAGKLSLYCYWTRNDPTQYYGCKKRKLGGVS